MKEMRWEELVFKILLFLTVFHAPSVEAAGQRGRGAYLTRHSHRPRYGGGGTRSLTHSLAHSLTHSDFPLNSL